MPSGGPERNERLTATTAALLLVLLAAEGVTILFIRPLLTLHMFLGVVLIPPVALKLASSGYRFVRYYTGDASYLQRPAGLFMRLLAPVLVASTAIVFASGVVLLASGQRAGTGSGFTRRASSSGSRLPRCTSSSTSGVSALVFDRRAPGFAVRVGLVTAALVIGLWVADETALHDRFT